MNRPSQTNRPAGTNHQAATNRQADPFLAGADEIMAALASLGEAGAVSLPLLTESFRRRLLSAARRGVWRPARRVVGRGDTVVRQEMVVCGEFPGASPFRGLAWDFQALVEAGVSKERLVLDPGMGFFLGSRPESSLAVLRELPGLRARFGLRLLVSVSRKSFLQQLAGRSALGSGAASLAAELYAASRGVDFIRTHAPGPLRDALAVQRALLAAPSS